MAGGDESPCDIIFFVADVAYAHCVICVDLEVCQVCQVCRIGTVSICKGKTLQINRSVGAGADHILLNLGLTHYIILSHISVKNERCNYLIMGVQAILISFFF